MNYPDSTQVTEYDYVVCGGGTAGCVIASRLAENPDVSVVLIESGAAKADVPLSMIPGAIFEILGSKDDWNICNEPGGVFGDRRIDLHRPKFISGASGANGTLCIRGTPHDFDAWGIDGWSGAEVFKYMAKAESFRGEAWFQADSAAHGRDGPILVAPHKNAPISDLVMESYQSAGLPLIHDMFTTGDVAHGCGHAPRTIYRGIRSTAADYLSGAYSKPNVTVRTLTFVDSLAITHTSSGQLKANGVHIVCTTDAGPVRQTLTARKEIILCGGAFGTPAILLRSGVGPSSELEKHGIQCRLSHEGVGQNLQDHLINMTFYEVDKPELTTDHLIWHGDSAAKSKDLWELDKSGFLGQFPFGAFAFARLDERLKESALWQSADRKPGRDPMGTVPEQPHVEFWNLECYNPKYLSGIPLGPNKSAFGMVTELFSQRSRGRVTLKSTDPTEKPVVDHNYLSDPLDMLVFAEGCRFADEIARQGAGTREIIAGMMPRSRTQIPQTREDWEQEIRENADTCFHPAGTCKMGQLGDPTAVVDSELHVLGIQGLRIADASIIPTLPCGHTQMTVYAIAEKAADMIKAAG